MGWFKDMIAKIFKIVPATERQIVIKEPLTFNENVLKNKIWYRADPAEIEQFFKQTARWDSYRSRFWAATPQGMVRKIHSGIVQIVIDRYRDIVTSDLTQIDFGEGDEITPMKDLWDEIAEDNFFMDLIGDAVAGSLSSGDGAFKISVDETGRYPVVEFYEADEVEFVRDRKKLKEIKFYTRYEDPMNREKEYRLEETYGKGYVSYRLFSEDGKEVPLDMLETTAQLQDAVFTGDFIMGVPLIFFGSGKWKGRGRALFDTKTDDIDALDEVISQWLDAVRKGRINRYIPEDMIPRNPENGELVKPNDFDNDYIAIGSPMKEGQTQKIEVVQPQISYEAYVNSYSSYLDLALQGVISPATLGIDLKKNDNAESQREKEKITVHVRERLVSVLDDVIPELVEKTMMVYDLMNGRLPGEYEVSAKFGEYAAPGFDSVVETVGKARTYGVMSIDKSVEEMYGDTLSDEEKQEEIERIKAEQGIVSMEEPGVNMEAGPFAVHREDDSDEGDSGEEGLPNDKGEGQGTS